MPLSNENSQRYSAPPRMPILKALGRARDLAVEGFDVSVAFIETEAALHRYVADIGHLKIAHGCDAQHMLIGSDPLDAAHGTGPETRARPVRYAEIHGHTDERDVEASKARSRCISGEAGAEQRRGIGKGPFPAVGRGEYAC